MANRTNGEQGNYRAIFFDLDGTLLPMEIEEFLGSYFGALERFAAKHDLDAETFRAGLRQGIRAMGTHDDGALNSDAYWSTFVQSMGGSQSDWRPLFDEFYAIDFGEIGKDYEPNLLARQAVETVASKEYPLVLATMPMFPLAGVEWRIAWAGLDTQYFKRITHYANSTSVKPKLAYYEENLRACGLEPQDVLMVGNNTKEDLACLELGMDAYLVTDHLLNPNDFDLETVKHGSFEDFLKWANSLPRCQNPVSLIEGGPIGRNSVGNGFVGSDPGAPDSLS